MKSTFLADSDLLAVLGRLGVGERSCLETLRVVDLRMDLRPANVGNLEENPPVFGVLIGSGMGGRGRLECTLCGRCCGMVFEAVHTTPEEVLGRLLTASNAVFRDLTLLDRGN